MSRRGAVGRSLPLPLFALVLAGAAGAAEIFDVRQGTNLALAVDPAGETIVVDLLGGLWQLPVAGGGATAWIPAGSGIAQPRFDRAGERIVFQRWLDGQWDLWQLTLADGEYAPLTATAFNEREPEYSPDGRAVVFAGDEGGSYELWSLDLASGTRSRLNDEPGDSRFPSYAASGELVYAHRLGARSSLRLGGAGRGTTLVESERRLEAPSWRPGGGVVVFNERVEGLASDLSLYIDADEPVRRRLTEAEDVFVGRIGWLSAAEYVYAADGQLWRRRIGSLERTPIHLFAGAVVDTVEAPPVTAPLDAEGPHAVVGVNGLVRHEPTGLLAFSALGDLWLVDDDELRRLTDDASTEAWPDFSPDGEWLFFASDRGGTMQVWRLRLKSGQLLQVSDEAGRVFLPRVSADGRFVAFLETAGYGPWDAASLELIEIESPFRSTTLATGLFDARDLSWQGSQVRLVARDAAAREPLARVFVTPAADTGALPAAGSPSPAAAPAPLPAELLPRWQPAAVGPPYVIRAGRMFDGIRDSYTYLVDIHVEGRRIANIVRRGQLPLPERVIDVGESTVLPGLIDVHAHLSAVAGSEPGRLWLAHGITTVREVMADPREALERAEAWAGGQQPGPRLVISPGAPLAGLAVPPGSPIVIGQGQVARGLAHGIAEQLAREAARTPLPLPAVLAPGAGGGPPELSLSTLGRSYQDVIGRLNASGAWLPTGIGALAAADPAGGGASLAGTIERVMRSSGRIAIGSDAPAVAYGSGFHDELELLAGQGIPKAQILRWATAGGGLALGLSQELGTLEPGRLADLVVIDGDPLDDLDDLRQIEAVVMAGVWIDIAELDAAR